MRSSTSHDKHPVSAPQQELPSEIASSKYVSGRQAGISLRQPPWHVWILGAVTFKLYLVYWGYKNWRDLAAQVVEDSARFSPENLTKSSADTVHASTAALGEDSVRIDTRETPALEGFLSRLAPEHMASFRDCSPMLRTIWMFVPYVNNYLLLTLALGIARIHPDKASLVARQPVLCAAVAVFATITLSMLSILPGAWYLLFLLSVLPAAVMQSWLNSYWKAVEPDGLLYRAAFTLKELVVVAAGALFLGYIVVGFLMGAHTLKG